MFSYIYKNLYKCSFFFKYFLLIWPYDPDSWWQLRLKIHFLIWPLPPLVPSVSFSPFVVRTKLKERGASLKGRPRSLPPGLSTSAMTETLLNYWEMVYQSRHIMRPTESYIKLSLTPSLLRFDCPARLSTTICNFGSTGDFNNLERFLQLMLFFTSLKYENKRSCVTGVKASLHKLG